MHIVSAAWDDSGLFSVCKMLYTHPSCDPDAVRQRAEEAGFSGRAVTLNSLGQIASLLGRPDLTERVAQQLERNTHTVSG